ncbi:hypothetical protein DQ237_16945 [Blastococcus sp. TF02-8]|uniref:hypothetical protein n=1 Tax=Blastococcus sp. TF02-8 TaxID=2250574 RepID=UPI000DEA9EFC|nr:hypothetical protein [Blastococcus sp. TF02-8]RBY93661.1 hypothetical protein DQ237_16945 [Blastococcus sp. TF02-8]
MSSSQQAHRPAPAHVSPDLSGRAPARSLAGLIDVLDRADAGRPRPRPAVHRAARPAPLRSVQPAPLARPARAAAPLTPRVVVVPERVRQPLGGLRGIVRRAALWGAGEQREYLAWPASTHRAAVPGRRRAAVRDLVRRATLWGAGEHGEHLAWGGPAPVRELEPPVVLRELPSTPSIQPVAPSPAAALLPAGPASSPGSRTGTAAPDATDRPSHPGSTDPATWSRARVARHPGRDWPSPGRYGARSTPPTPPVRVPSRTSWVPGVPAPRSPGGDGDARARGDPLARATRGSPLPPRRTWPAGGAS